MTDPPPPPSDVERELHDLRARAYGRDPDIDTDPGALARLVELEAARAPGASAYPEPESATGAEATASPRLGVLIGDHPVTDETPVEEPSRPPSAAPPNGSGWKSRWRRATDTIPRRIALTVGSVVVIVLLTNSALSVLGLRPDTILRVSTAEPDDQFMIAMESLGIEADLSTIQGYGSYRRIEPWSATDPSGYTCLMAFEPIESGRGGMLDAQCVPPGTDLFVNVGVWPTDSNSFRTDLPGGSVIRFHLRENTVNVFVYPTSQSD